MAVEAGKKKTGGTLDSNLLPVFLGSGRLNLTRPSRQSSPANRCEGHKCTDDEGSRFFFFFTFSNQSPASPGAAARL